ncbi:hypothetical protein [Eremococcus coleocola]|uniref:hypothetical protein n=1 Tax=Eremococcus coleocola TaxID=88132 RepID=UPI0003FCEC8F|nr:hypothetical protein [Eremococcus coleocola]
MLSKVSCQLKIEFKHNLLPSILASFIMIGIAYFIFGLGKLDGNSQAMVIERFLPFPGIFSIVTLFYTEHQSPIKDILRMRQSKLELIYLLRFTLRLIIWSIISYIYISLLTEGQSLSELIVFLLHSLSIGIFIGIIGLFLFSCTNNISIAFLCSVGLMLAQWFLPKNKPSLLKLFTMPNISINRIFLIFAFSLVLLVLSIIIWKRKNID